MIATGSPGIMRGKMKFSTSAAINVMMSQTNFLPKYLAYAFNPSTSSYLTHHSKQSNVWINQKESEQARALRQSEWWDTECNLWSSSEVTYPTTDLSRNKLYMIHFPIRVSGSPITTWSGPVCLFNQIWSYSILFHFKQCHTPWLRPEATTDFENPNVLSKLFST